MLVIKDNYHISGIRFYLLTSALATRIYFTFFHLWYICYGICVIFVTCKIIIISATNFKHSTYKTQ